MSTNRWIHCNSCYHQLARKERKFYHLSCRHVLCKQCMAKTNRGTTCPLCKKPLERFTELNNQMDRKDKMFYDPGSLKMLGVAFQSVIFQHKQREDMVRGILRCRVAIVQIKEMENVLREKIVEAQRRYEKFRTYRRNLQDSLRQASPRYAPLPLMGPTGRTPLQSRTENRAPERALPNREDDSASRRHQERRRPETITFPSASPPLASDFSFGTPVASERSPCAVVDGSFTREQQHVKIYSPQANAGRFMGEGSKPGLIGGNESRFSNDSGISNMQTPASSNSYAGSSRMMGSANRMQQRQHPYSPSTPVRPRPPGPSMYRFG